MSGTCEALALYKKLKKAKCTSDLNLSELQKIAKLCAKKAKNYNRELHMLKLRSRTERDILRNELRSDGVDREANAARVAERQRILFERSSAQAGALSAYDRASSSASYVEAALASLCPVTLMRHCEGSEVLHARSKTRVPTNE
jgi:hypothetical protein